MKSLFKVLALSVLAAFIALGCSNTSGDAVSNGDSGASKTATKTIKLVATGDAEAIVFPVKNNGVSATIMADTIDADTLKYYLFCTNKVTSAPINPEAPLAFTAADPSTPNIGTVDLNIEDGYYEFKLYATETTAATPITENTVKTGALFLGQTEADLRTSNDTVSFYLTSDTLTGSADVALKLKTTGWTVPAGYTISAGITKKTDGSVVPGPNMSPIASITASDPGTAQYSQTGVTAGTYNFEVRFTNSDGSKTYVWSDTIIVAPNHNIAKTIAIPEVIDEPPVAPTAFNATFLDPDSLSKEFYNVEFHWAAASTVNEQYFRIELLEIPSATAWGDINADTSTPWNDGYRTTLGNTADTYLTKLGANFYGNESQNWIAGSLRKNNEKATVALPLGKRYLARICAVNDAGDSEFCYVDFDNAVPAALTTGYSKFDPDSKVVNRYRLSYNLLGGTITIPGSPDTTSTKDIIEYRTQNTVANGTAGTYVGAKITGSVDVPTADIWNPSTDTTTYKSLKKGEKAWTAWRLDSSASAAKYGVAPDYDPPDWTGCENLVLYASYSPTTAGVTILDDNDWSVALANFTATPPSGPAGVDVTELDPNSTIALNLGASGAGNILWTGAYTDDQTDRGVKWTNVTYTIKKSGQAYNIAGPKQVDSLTADGFTVTTDMSGYVEGKYLVTFNAYAPHKQEPYTYTIVVKITSN